MDQSAYFDDQQQFMQSQSASFQHSPIGALSNTNELQSTQADDHGRPTQPIMWTLAQRQLRLPQANLPTALVCLYTLINILPRSVFRQQHSLPLARQGFDRFHRLILVKSIQSIKKSLSFPGGAFFDWSFFAPVLLRSKSH
jgi:hypothetical protein